MTSQLIGNRFIVLRTLGEGAAGTVFEAALTHATPYAAEGSRVAVKLYKPWVLSEKNQGYRIEQELRTGIDIDCPNVVRTFEVGAHENSIYLVMEHLKGTPLRAWLLEHVNPSFSDVSHIIHGIAKGLYSLHTNGLIHRDIKPENIMVTSDGPVILDLGVLRNITRDTVISGEEFLGTIRYAAPEYLFGDPYDETIDVYSLGLILLEIAKGRPHIAPDTYWSRMILEKGQRMHLWRHPLRETAIDKPTLFEKMFVKVLIDGCITTRRESYEEPTDRLPTRFTSAQLIAGFDQFNKGEPFLYPVSEFDHTLQEWPAVPSNVTTQVRNFLSSPQGHLSRECREIIWNAAYKEDGWFNELDKWRLTPNEADAFERLHEAGLITDDTDDYSSPVWDRITPLAWQLLLRGVITSDTQQSYPADEDKPRR